MQEYYKNNPEKFQKRKKVRMQDKIDASFKKEREKEIKIAYCQHRMCPKPGNKYVAGSGVSFTFRGMEIKTCCIRCKEGFLEDNHATV